MKQQTVYPTAWRVRTIAACRERARMLTACKSYRDTLRYVRATAPGMAYRDAIWTARILWATIRAKGVDCFWNRAEDQHGRPVLEFYGPNLLSGTVRMFYGPAKTGPHAN